MSWNPNQGPNPNQQGQYGGHNPPPVGGQQGTSMGAIISLAVRTSSPMAFLR